MRVRSQRSLENLQPEAQAAFAVACAQRLMNAHVRLPQSDQRAFTLSWEPVLEEIWSGLEEKDSSREKATVAAHLKNFEEGPFNLEVDQDDAGNGADEDAAAGSIFAAEAFCRGDVRSAYWAANRLLESTFMRIHDMTRKHPQPSVLEQFAHPLMQQDYRRVLTALELLESRPWAPALIPLLRDHFELDDE